MIRNEIQGKTADKIIIDTVTKSQAPLDKAISILTKLEMQSESHVLWWSGL